MYVQAFVLGGEADGAGGTDTSAIFNSDREQATTAAPRPSVGGVEMAALWLRLRRAVVGHTNSSRQAPEGLEDGQGEGGSAGSAEREGAPGAFGLDGVEQVDLSCLGAERFEERDPAGSGSVTPAAFREVIHFWRDCSRTVGRGARSLNFPARAHGGNT